MTTMGNVWDRTVAVLEGRGGMLAGIAATALFLPAVVRAAAQAYVDRTSPPGLILLGALVTIVALVVAVWGHLAVLAAASDPAIHRGDAARMASRRLLPALGLLLLVLLVLGLLFAPMLVVMAGSGVDMTAMAAGGNPTIPPQLGLFVGLYTIVFLIVALVVGTRLVLLYPVVLLEQAGLGAFARSVRLTRGLTWRILGVLLLYGIVILVAAGAAKLVAGTVAGLLLGPSATAAFLAAVAGDLVATALSVVAIVFTAQLYRARREAPALA